MKGMRQWAGWRRAVMLTALGLLLAAGVLLVAGCKIQVGIETTIKDNGSGIFGFRLSADKEIQDLMSQQGGGDIFQDLSANIPEGWELVEGTEDDGTRWVLATVDFANKDELASLLQMQEGPVSDLGDSSIDFEQETTLFRVITRYKARLDAGAAMGAIGEGAGEDVPVDMLSSIIQFENRVTLPGTIGANNATEVKGNTLIWRPTTSGAADMTAQSSSLRWPVVIGFIVGGLILLGLIAALIVLLVRRRRPQAAAPVAGTEYVHEPPQAGAAAAEAPAEGRASPVGGEAPAPAPAETATAPLVVEQGVAPLAPTEPETAPAFVSEQPARGEEDRPV